MSDPSEQPSPPETAPAAARRPPRLSQAVSPIAWLYLAVVLATWLVMRQAADRWWPATLVLFGPRWLFALPLLLLIPVAFARRRRALVPLAAAAVVALGLLMDFRVPWRAAARSDSAGPRLRVLTCNTDRSHIDLPALAALVADARPDVVALQEWDNRGNPADVFRDGRWHMIDEHELYIASRFPIRRAEAVSDSWTAPGEAVRYEIDTPAGTIDFYNLHLASPHRPFDAVLRRDAAAPAQVQKNSDRRRRQLETLRDAAARRPGIPALMAGDFNTPNDSPILRQTLGPSFRNAFSTAGLGYGRSYRVRWTQTRIDHVLATPDLPIHACHIGPHVGSAHRPVIADLALPTPAK